jgi:GNAT superfamily N-acetyltransferase
MTEILVRLATVDDTAGLASLLRSIGWFGRISEEPPEKTVEKVTAALALALAGDSHAIWVAEGADGRVLAYAAAHWLPYLFLPGPEGYLSELFVREEARGQGIGSRLLEAVKAEAKRRGCSRLQLVNFRQRESYQRGFYAKAGWEERPDGASFVLYL